MAAMLSTFGECKIVSAGRDATRAFDDARRRFEPFDVVLADIHLPDCPGCGLARRLRVIETSRPAIAAPRARIVATTTQLVDGSTQKRLGHTVDDWLEKPFGLDELRAAVRGREARALPRERDGG